MKTVAINIRLDEKIHQAVKQAADADNRSVSNWIKLAMIQKLRADRQPAQSRRHRPDPKPACSICGRPEPEHVLTAMDNGFDHTYTEEQI